MTRQQDIHGTPACYSISRCRCDECTEASRRRQWRYRRDIGYGRQRRREPIHVVRRRIEALAVVGWSSRDVSTLIGVNPTRIRDMLAKQTHVSPEVADRVRAAYSELWSKPSTSPMAKRTRRYAARAGWHSPLAWDNIDDPNEQPATYTPDPDLLDEVAIEEAMAGRGAVLTKRERAEATRRLNERGMSAVEIADRLCTTPRSVTRARARNRAA